MYSFWKVYMPLYEARSTAFEPIRAYFSGQELSRTLYSDLEYAMTQMILRDDRVAWLALYSPQREKNYILLSDSRQIQTFGDEFPYIARLQGRNMKVLGLAAPVKVREADGYVSLKLPGGLGQANERTCQDLLTGMMVYLQALSEVYPENLIVRLDDDDDDDDE